jgi:hypothetical protein
MFVQLVPQGSNMVSLGNVKTVEGFWAFAA